MTQSDTPTKDERVAEESRPRDIVGEIMDRLSYAIGLGTVMFIVVAIPALLWPRDLGQYFTSYTYMLVIVIAYFCVPFARRYMPDFKPRIKRDR